MSSHNTVLALLVTALTLLFASGLRAETLSIESVQWRAPLPGQSVASLYLTIENRGTDEIVLEDIELDWARKAEFHTHSHDNGMMRMRRIKNLPVAPGETVKMSPGGLHVMIFGVQAGHNDKALSLVSSSGARIEVIIPKATR